MPTKRRSAQSFRSRGLHQSEPPPVCRGRAGGARGDHRGCGCAHLCRCGAAEAVAGHRRLLAGGENFVTAERFIHAAEGFGRGEGPTVMAWVRLYAAQADAGIGFLTRGLRAFTQSRLGFAFLKQRLGELMQYVRIYCTGLDIEWCQIQAWRDGRAGRYGSPSLLRCRTIAASKSAWCIAEDGGRQA